MEFVRERIRGVFEAESSLGDGGWLLTSVRMVLMRRGVSALEMDVQVDRVCGFVRGYVETAPGVLEALRGEGAQLGIVDDVEGVVGAARAYFEAAVDYIPDNTGVVGLVDDAYLALRLVERFLVELGEGCGGLSRANDAVGEMIGEPLRSRLDASVESVLALAGVAVVADRLRGTDTARLLSDAMVGAFSTVAGIDN